MGRNNLEQKPRSCEEIDLETIYKTLLDLKTTLDTHITEENVYRPKVIELVDILDRSKGVVWFIKIISVVSVAGWGMIYWIRDHLRF